MLCRRFASDNRDEEEAEDSVGGGVFEVTRRAGVVSSADAALSRMEGAVLLRWLATDGGMVAVVEEPVLFAGGGDDVCWPSSG